MIKPVIPISSMIARLRQPGIAAAVSAIIFAGGTAAAAAYPQDENPAVAIAADDAPSDEMPAEEATPVQKAVDLYMRMRTLQTDGAPEDELYDTAYMAYEAAAAAIVMDNLVQEETDQMRGILLDLNNTMARAAVSYSCKGDSKNMTRFAKAYIDTQLMPEMATAEFQREPELYPALVYVAASGSYNAGDIDNAIKYFEAYLATDDRKNRENVALFYGQALLQTQQQTRGLEAVVDAANEYPANFQLLTIAMQLCIDTKRLDMVGPLVERALTVRPTDEKLLNLQAQVHEYNRNYRPALDIYMQLDENRPNTISINEAIARCYYNLGTLHYNESVTAVSEKDAAKSRRQSNAYFSSAAEKFEELVENDPNNLKYLNAMASSYAVLGNKSKVDAVNVQLSALGSPAVAMNQLPAIIGDGRAAASSQSRNIPSYQEYARNYVSEEMAKWAKRGEFERVDEYNKRLAPDNIRKEQMRLSSITEEKYLKDYASHLMISEMKLEPYDVENETYAITSDFGPVYIKVPLKNKEAEIFKNSWEKVQIRNAKFFIDNDNIAISTITFHSPNGKDYTYNANAALSYAPPMVMVDVDKLVEDAQRNYKPAVANNTNKSKNSVTKITLESDVDKDIPVNKQTNTNTVAMIIANENYGKVSAVTSAEHDGNTFARYCRETLGIPDDQVIHIQDATYGNTLSALSRLKNTVQALGPGTDVIFYYAGHGVPDESSKEAYLLPVDADPMVMATAYPLSRLYEELGNMGASDVMVFMDACFSGANRGDGMLADARSVVLRPKPAAPKGSMYVLSAADGNETALPWKDKNHGVFTYYLLKKLQESKGNATLQEIADYVSSQVQRTASTTLGGKQQHPKMNVTGPIANELSKKKLRK